MSEASIRELRLAKLARLRELGADPYAVERFPFERSAAQLLAEFDALEGRMVRFAGRIASQRFMGRAAFMHVSDGDERIQAYLRRDGLGDAGWEVCQLMDIGDHAGVEGELFRTKTGEKSIHVRKLTPLSKALRPLPLGKEKDGERWYGLADVEQRYRHRHLDLACNPDARKVLILRSRIVSGVRRFFDARGYLEVETPLLHLEAGGAAARPFLTHYNAYDLDVKLRVSLELYLKRLICGDLPKVYEIGRVFRNEGVSNRHNPEFTLLEFYEAYANLEDMMTVVEDCFRAVCLEVFGTTKVAGVDFGPPWRRLDLMAEIARHTGMTMEDFPDLKAAQRRAKALGVGAKAEAAGARIEVERERHLGGLIEKLLEVFVEPSLQEPSFLTGYPLDTSPLAKKDPARPGFARRFEGYVLGREVCNAFSEINDPIDQRERFEDQAAQRAEGDAEAHPMDEDFIHALESGMPPTGGVGIGIDRMAMLLTGAEHVREVLLFPMMRPPPPKPE
jgi:lysyl-tRNA synthetase class 2